VLNALLEVVLPVVLVLGVGYGVGRFVKPDLSAITKVTLYALIPALTLHSLLHTTVKLEGALRVVLGFLLLVGISGIVAARAARAYPPNTRRAVIASVTTGNNGNFGLSLSLFAFGQEGLEYSVIIFIVSSLNTFLVTSNVLANRVRILEGVWETLKLPLVWCALIGVALNAFGVVLPVGIDRGIGLLGQAAVPMVLLSLGLQLGSSGLPKVTVPVLLASSLRVLAGPMIAFGVAAWVGATGLERAALVLSGAMPTAVNTLLLAREFGGDVETVAGTVLLTTAASLPMIALVVTLLR
jgi:malate permease and related proteins